MIQFENVSKHYGSNVVVDRLNLDVEQGNLVTLIGASGCGKTTTLKMVNRIIEPTSGKIIVNGENAAGGKARIISARACRTRW